MESKLIIDTCTSIENKVIPFLRQNLETTGIALLQFKDTADKLETDMLLVSALVGKIFGENFGYHTIESEGDSSALEAHTEGISNTTGIIPYFSLGCIVPATTGGETRIFDARKAAGLAISESLSEVELEYTSLANPNEVIRHHLIENDEKFGEVMRYRSKVETNRVISSGNVSPEKMYQLVDTILEDCIVTCHSWIAGELLFVNNLISLHDRLPFQGRRQMLRVRYNDYINTRLRY